MRRILKSTRTNKISFAGKWEKDGPDRLCTYRSTAAKKCRQVPQSRREFLVYRHSILYFEDDGDNDEADDDSTV
jgi:hypothetical protein